MIGNKLQQQIQEAMKVKNEVRVSTLRLLSSAFNYEKIEKQHDLTEEEEISVIRRQAKQRKDSIEAYKKAGDENRAQKEESELKILQEFLPPEIGEEELMKIVEGVISELGDVSIKDMGKIIGAVKAKTPDADGGKVAEIVKNKLSD